MYTKSEQLKSKRIKPEPVKDRDYLQWLKDRVIPCEICGVRITEMHHIKRNSSDLKDDTKMLSLCPEHHRGSILSPHGTPNKFREVLSIFEQLQISQVYYEQYKAGIL